MKECPALDGKMDTTAGIQCSDVNRNMFETLFVAWPSLKTVT